MTQSETQDLEAALPEKNFSQVKSRQRFQFGISGLLVALFGVAIGLSVLHIKEAHYGDCFLAAVSTWFAFGLLMQSHDLFFALRRNHKLDANRKWAWRYAIAWRLVITASLFFYYIIFQSVGYGLFTIEDVAWDFFTERKLLEILFLLSLIVVLWSIYAAKPNKKGWYSRSIAALGGIICITWFFWICVDRACVPFLVYIAVWAIEMGEQLRYTQSIFGPQQIQEHYCLLLGSFLSVLLLALSIISCILMVSRWQKKNKTWQILAISSFGCLVLSSAFPIWVYTFELKRLSSAFAEGLWTHSNLWWIVGALLCIASATGVTWRIARRAVTSTDGKVENERPTSRVYYHEQPFVIACLLIAMIFELAQIFMSSGLFMAVYCFFVPIHCVTLALFLMATKIFWQRLRRPVDLPSAVNFEVSPFCYALTWLNVLGIIVVGAAALAWLGFSMWVLPYWSSFW